MEYVVYGASAWMLPKPIWGACPMEFISTNEHGNKQAQKIELIFRCNAKKI